MGKATDFKFGWYIHRIHLNKSQFKILEKIEHGRIQGLPKFLEYPLFTPGSRLVLNALDTKFRPKNNILYTIPSVTSFFINYNKTDKYKSQLKY